MAGPLHLTRERVLGMMATLRPLFRYPYDVSNYSDDALADGLVETARGDPEWWFGDDHIRAAYTHVTSQPTVGEPALYYVAPA